MSSSPPAPACDWPGFNSEYDAGMAHGIGIADVTCGKSRSWPARRAESQPAVVLALPARSPSSASPPACSPSSSRLPLVRVPVPHRHTTRPPTSKPLSVIPKARAGEPLVTPGHTPPRAPSASTRPKPRASNSRSSVGCSTASRSTTELRRPYALYDANTDTVYVYATGTSNGPDAKAAHIPVIAITAPPASPDTFWATHCPPCPNRQCPATSGRRQCGRARRDLRHVLLHLGYRPAQLHLQRDEPRMCRDDARAEHGDVHFPRYEHQPVGPVRQRLPFPVHLSLSSRWRHRSRASTSGLTALPGCSGRAMGLLQQADRPLFAAARPDGLSRRPPPSPHWRHTSLGGGLVEAPSMIKEGSIYWLFYSANLWERPTTASASRHARP